MFLTSSIWKQKESKGKADRKEMDNVLKKTIREEIEKYNKEKGEGSKSEGILPVNASSATPK